MTNKRGGKNPWSGGQKGVPVYLLWCPEDEEYFAADEYEAIQLIIDVPEKRKDLVQ